MSGSVCPGEGGCALLLPHLLKEWFSEAEPSDPITDLWVWTLARNSSLRLLIPFRAGPGWKAAVPKLKTTWQQPESGEIKRGEGPS